MLSENDHAGSGERASMPRDPEKDTNQPSDERVERTTPTGVQCSVCGTAFRRPEHLKRHLRSHTKEKPFECAQCGRHFSRSDTLHRHELSHHAPASEGGSDRTHRITVKTFRACFSCATARVRCSGGMPCGRCETRSLECQYPTKRRPKAKLRNESPRGLSSAEVHEQESQTAQSPSSRLSVDHAVSHRMTSFSVNGVSESQPSSKGLTNTTPHSAEAHRFSERKWSVTGDSGLQPYTASSGAGPAASYMSSDHLQPYNTMSNPKNFNPDMASPGLRDTEMLGFEHQSFDHSMLYSLNWLPEFLAGTPHAQAQQGLHLVSNHHTSRIAWQLPSIQNGQSPPTSESVSLTTPGHISLTELRDSVRYSHITGGTSPQMGALESDKGSADFPVNHNGAHFSNNPTSQTSWSTPGTIAASEQPIEEPSASRFAFPSVYGLHIKNITDDLAHSVRPIEASTHNDICHNFVLLCCHDNPFFSKFESEIFPGLDDCNRYLVCYFSSFQTVYPLLHLPSFDPNRCHWILLLALLAIGCHTSESQVADQCTAAFHELIRRAIFYEKEKSHRTRLSIDLIQAILFNCIALLHGENEESQLAALSIFKDLVTLSKREHLLASSPGANSRGSSGESVWMAWVQDEIRRRTGYCIWLLDCSLAYYFDDRPLLSLDDGQAPLPAHEDLWQASDAQAWGQLWDQSKANESLYDAVQILYIEKRLVTGIGDFSHILLIHALYHRMWEVGDYFRRPLSFWNPTAKKQSRDTAIPTGSVWLPGIPSYSQWRNSACDCLDILDWTASGTISKNAGLDPPTVLHLHAARAILLAPFREIRSLATSLTTGKLQWSQREEVLEWRYVWRWAQHDQYKARLSIVHAGATLCHVRRYSSSVFYEPVTVFLAVLILWAYGSCHAHHHQTSSPFDPASRLPPLRESSFIQLDRPCDDKLVQLFVREGHSMRADLNGVGDICAHEAPDKILRVGCEILSGLTAWGISKRFVQILTRLADVMRRSVEMESDHRTENSGR